MKLVIVGLIVMINPIEVIIVLVKYFESNIIDVNFFDVSFELLKVYKDACKVGFEDVNDLVVCEFPVHHFSDTKLVLKPTTTATMKYHVEYGLAGTVTFLLHLIVLL
jgi:hypothetical protein